MGRYPDKIKFWSSVVSMSAQPLRGWTNIGATLCQRSSPNRYRPEWCDVFQVPGIVRRLKVTGSRIDLLLQHGKRRRCFSLGQRECFPVYCRRLLCPWYRQVLLPGWTNIYNDPTKTHTPFIRRPQYYIYLLPANTRHFASMLDHHLRRWPNIETVLVQNLVFCLLYNRPIQQKS